MFNIPISTLQKWEREKVATVYYKLIATVTIDNDNMCKIEDNNGKIYYYTETLGI